MANKVIDLDGIAYRVKEQDNAGMWQDCYLEARPVSKICKYVDDFVGFDTGHWVVTETNGSCTQALADTRNGVLVLTSIATEDNGTQIQLGTGTTGEAFAPAASKNLWFETYIASNDADQNDIFVGLHVQDTSIIAGFGTDYIGFQVVDASASINCLSCASSVVTTSSAVATLSDDTFVKLGFKITGTSKIEFYVNDNLVATHTTTIPTALMQCSLAHLTGEAVANTLSIDYVAIAQDR